MHSLSDKGCKGTVVNMTHLYEMEGYFKLRLLSTLPVIEKKVKNDIRYF